MITRVNLQENLQVSCIHGALVNCRGCYDADRQTDPAEEMTVSSTGKQETGIIETLARLCPGFLVAVK